MLSNAREHEPDPASDPAGGREEPESSRWSVYGEVWARYLRWGIANAPWYLEVIYVGAYTVLFFLACGQQRRAVMANLRVLLPGSTPFANMFRAVRVFWNFAWTIVDETRGQMEPGTIEWEITGADHFENLRTTKGGAIIATAHMGSYDLAGPVFSDRFERPVHAVRAPERVRATHEILRQGREAVASGGYGVVYNEPGNMLGLTLARALGRGEFVAVQADRMLFDIAGTEAEYEGCRLTLPKGPFVLAQTTGAPVFPLFVIRSGRRRYRVDLHAPFFCRRTERDREAEIREATGEWLGVLGPILREHWYQWFVFEPVFPTTGDVEECGRA